MEPRRFSWEDSTGNHQIVLAWVPGTSGTSYGFGHGSQRRAIELSSFFISTTPVTQALWMHVMAENPAKHHNPHCPVENVSFEQIVSPGGFLDRINASDVLSGVGQGDASVRFRLPSEAEWEYAARGGPNWKDDFAFSGSNNPDEVAWYGPRWRRADEAVFKLLGWPRGWYPTTFANCCHGIPRLTLWVKRPRTNSDYSTYRAMCGSGVKTCAPMISKRSRPTGGHTRSRHGSPAPRWAYNNWDLHCRVWWRYGIEPGAHDGSLDFVWCLAPTSQAGADAGWTPCQ